MSTQDLISVVTSGFLAACFASVALQIWRMLGLTLSRSHTQRLSQLGIPNKLLPRVVEISGAIAAIGVLTGLVTGTTLIAIGLSGMLFLVLPFAFRFYVDYRISEIRSEIAEMSIIVANSTKAGLSLPAALESAGETLIGVLSSQIKKVAIDYKTGIPLEDSLKALKERMCLEEFSLFTAAILTCWKFGGDLPGTLERISRSLQQHRRLQRKIQVDTAEGRKEIAVLTVFPFIALAALAVLMPQGTKLFMTTTSGQITLLGIFGAVIIAALWSRSILRIDA
jgi:tight adherence protein B